MQEFYAQLQFSYIEYQVQIQDQVLSSGRVRALIHVHRYYNFRHTKSQ